MKSAAVGLSVVVLAAVAGCMTSSPKPLSKPEPVRAAEINLEIGTDALRKGNLNQAKEKIDKAVEQNPRNPKAQITAGMLYERLGDTDKADSHFAKGLALDPKNPEVLNNYGAFLCQRGKHERGEKLMIEAATNPLYRTPEVAYLNASNCARNGGDLKGAEDNLRKALKVQPKYRRRAVPDGGPAIQTNRLSVRPRFSRTVYGGWSHQPGDAVAGRAHRAGPG